MAGFQLRLRQAVYAIVYIRAASAAQNADGPVQLLSPDDFPGISKDCAAALSVTISCPQSLLYVQSNHGVEITSQDIPDLCQTSCSTSIASYRAAVDKSCGAIPYTDPGNSNVMTYASFAGYALSKYKSTCVKSR